MGTVSLLAFLIISILGVKYINSRNWVMLQAPILPSRNWVSARQRFILLQQQGGAGRKVVCDSFIGLDSFIIII
jgi:hypothetical protein